MLFNTLLRGIAIPNWAGFGLDLVISGVGNALFLKVRDFWRVGLKPLNIEPHQWMGYLIGDSSSLSRGRLRSASCKDLVFLPNENEGNSM